MKKEPGGKKISFDWNFSRFLNFSALGTLGKINGIALELIDVERRRPRGSGKRLQIQ